jgi:hypothetical protein
VGWENLFQEVSLDLNISYGLLELEIQECYFGILGSVIEASRRVQKYIQTFE